MVNKCFFCELDLDVSGIGVSHIGEKGVVTLKAASEMRNDGKASSLTSSQPFMVHTLCRKKYTRKNSISAAVKRKLNESGPSTEDAKNDLRESIRSSNSTGFTFKTNCFFCSQTIDKKFYEREKKKPADKRRVVFEVRCIQFVEAVRLAADERNDSWGSNIKTRLSNVNDLIAADGIYHYDCYMKFTKSRITERGGKRGRPSTDYVEDAMKEICSFLENNDDCQFSFSELISEVTGPVPTYLTIKKKLNEIYGNRITITTDRNKIKTVC